MTPLLIAHRGASIDCLENTLPALRRARDLGVDRIELDVHRTRDGVVVVHHDEDLLRSAGDPRRIDSLTLAELRQIPLTYGRPGPGERVPSLREALDIADPVPLAIEVKAGDADVAGLADAVVAHLGTAPAEARSCILSFELPAVVRALLVLPAERVALVRNTEYGEDGWRDGLDIGVGIVVLSRRIATPAVLDALHAAGRQVWIYSLDDRESVTHWAQAGIDGIISNDPALAQRALRGDPASGHSA